MLQTKKRRRVIQGVLITGMLVVVISVFIVNPSVVSAKTEVKNQPYEGSWLFAVPEGGWSSIRANILYTERYHITGQRIYYTERVRSVTVIVAGATEIPRVVLGNVSHTTNSTEKMFKTWTSTPMWMDATWDSGSCEINDELVSYLKGKDVKGKLPFLVTCNGAIVPTRSGSIEMNLTYKNNYK